MTKEQCTFDQNSMLTLHKVIHKEKYQTEVSVFQNKFLGCSEAQFAQTFTGD